MEKTITIDGQKVRLKSTAATIYRYKQQFKKDYFADLLKLAKVFDTDGNTAENAESGNTAENAESINLEDLSWDQIDHLDMEVLFNFVWVLAKSADNTIPEPLEWLDQFDTFPIKEIFPEITGLLASSIQSVKK